MKERKVLVTVRWTTGATVEMMFSSLRVARRFWQLVKADVQVDQASIDWA